jgi:hypothetical protein
MAESEIRSDEIDVARIMEEIRQRVVQKQQAGIYPSTLKGISSSAPGATLSSLAGLRIEGEPITSHRPMLGRYIRLFKKFSRFWVRRYTDPVFLQQSYFNSEAAREIEKLQAEVANLKEQLERLSGGK